MAAETVCPKCGATMVQGFLLNSALGGYAVGSWREGKPRKSLVVGFFKVREPRPIPLGAFRCERCGFLELYSRPDCAAE